MPASHSTCTRRQGHLLRHAPPPPPPPMIYSTLVPHDVFYSTLMFPFGDCKAFADELPFCKLKATKFIFISFAMTGLHIYLINNLLRLTGGTKHLQYCSIFYRVYGIPVLRRQKNRFVTVTRHTSHSSSSTAAAAAAAECSLCCCCCCSVAVCCAGCDRNRIFQYK